MPPPEIETASLLRRLLALVVDWFASSLVVVAFMGPGDYYATGDPLPGFYTMLVFILESAFFTALAGGSFGKLATRLRVVRADGSGQPIDLLRALVRAVLICLVIPPLIFRPDGRGLHDMVARSATITLPRAG